MKQLNRVLRENSPRHAPTLWIVINGVCCLAAALVFLWALVVVGRADEEDRVIKESYLVYNLVVCIVWFSEVVLYMCYSTTTSTGNDDDDDGRPRWQLWLELLVAAYFTVDCAVTVYRWQLMKVHGWEIYLDTSIDFVFYVYYLVLSIRALGRQQQRQQQETEIEVGGDYYAPADDAYLATRS